VQQRIQQHRAVTGDRRNDRDPARRIGRVEFEKAPRTTPVATSAMPIGIPDDDLAFSTASIRQKAIALAFPGCETAEAGE